MRKNLTISLSPEDWRRVQSMAGMLGETYSRVFHRLIESGAGAAANQKRIAKYRALLGPNSGFFAGRAQVFSRAGKRKQAAA